ncbi:DNA adenine methylase [Natronomonas sp. LN261]|uniref:DNA adenine methylase n=1 Tax=Natronomonas sp. LN261 TaxID=2750669 RepID=UPI001C673B18|nr:DNA adenine methylase [Natronomonas sp. LN261]
MARCLPFRWYGGKYSHLKWLLPQLPEAHRYIEPFGGSGSVLLNREPSPVEVYNDRDSDVTNFFKVLRDHRDELLEKIALTPFSREEFECAIKNQGDETLSDIEKARLFFVRAGQVRSGLAQDATPGRWAYCKNSSRRDMAAAISRWHSRLDNLDQAANRIGGYSEVDAVVEELEQEGKEKIADELKGMSNQEAVKALQEAKMEDMADRFRRVQIENRDAIDVIQTYGDSDNSLIYCDPPYPHESRTDGATTAYRYEMTDEEHTELADALHDSKAKVAISSYLCDLTEELYGDWNRIDVKKTSHTSKESREESLWMNYPVPSPDLESVQTTIRL